jgi:hypothetical protein
MNRLSQAGQERLTALLAELDAKDGKVRKRPPPKPIMELAAEYIKTPVTLSPTALSTLGIRPREDAA